VEFALDGDEEERKSVGVRFLWQRLGVGDDGAKIPPRFAGAPDEPTKCAPKFLGDGQQHDWFV
jgi:hypothetical protein